jgi:hypothetical protein
VVHKLRHLQTNCPKDIYPEMKEDFHEISLAAGSEAAKQAYDRFIH